MKKKFLVAATFAAVLAMQACNSNKTDGSGTDSITTDTTITQTTTATDTTGMNPAATDANAFMEKAAVGGMMEVEAGKLAQSKSSNAQVKDFAAMMVADHSKANDELKAIAEKKSVTLPAALPAMEQAHLDEMKKMSGADFDKHYIGMMVTDHAKTVDLFKAGGKNSDSDISAFANKTLPTIEGHYKKATEIQSSLK
ncbi:DUF4142 domain-containing protein [Pedobacter duraquae]|uniref:Putative membrane protein n=1 Tax=Pedobacter duraquae TaxID=425511 RepID=A0A4R6IQ60_9SPHI|nr:DUF4142 domain-containing protein [Pedobacter duraquae]TDO24321.1 putative membrane protein [Pedobacter duraquae]